ncbi:MAG: alpha-2-macroglobulin family protein [Myxococcota bacterium]
MLLTACMMADRAAEPVAQSEPAEKERKEEGWAPSEDAPAAPPASAPAGGAGPMMEKAARAGMLGAISGIRADEALDVLAKGAPADAEKPAPARAWFPESFLWMPMVETDASGRAEVPVRVPDTLTTWRVLGYGQTRAGAQAGALLTFASRLPASVELTVPSFLYAGDAPRIPVRVSNAGEDVLRERVELEGTAIATPAVAPGGTWVDTAVVPAGSPGTLRLVAHLGSLDTVERSIPVRPVGRAVEQVRGGTLAGPREYAMSGTPGGAWGTIELVAFPGSLGVVARELEIAGLRDRSVADAAYAFALADLGAPLVEKEGADPEALRALRITAYQRLTRATRAPSAAVAADALAGLSGADADSLAGKLAKRLGETLDAQQQPDGLWGLGAGVPLDRVLAHTARCAWALGPEHRAARLRATGAFERHRARLDSPYVLAWALAAGIVEDVEPARAKLREALRTDPDGSRSLRVDARRADGRAVPEAEATALAILALAKDDPLRPDLAAGLLGLYREARGFGDGAANLLAVRALAEVFAGDVPASATIRLLVDGVEVGNAALDPTQPYAPVRVRGAGLAAGPERAVRVVSEPPIPGLAFTLTARDWVAWEREEAAGLDLRVATPAGLRAGEPAAVRVELAAPPDLTVDVEIGLPAGVEADRAELKAWVDAGRVAGFSAEDGKLTLRGVPVGGGAVSLDVPVTPTLAGELWSGPMRAIPAGDEANAFTQPPARWEIGG